MATITVPRKRRASAGTNSAGMRREVGLLGLTFTSLGCVIGSGWLLGALSASEAAGPAALVSWGIAGGSSCCSPSSTPSSERPTR